MCERTVTWEAAHIGPTREKQKEGDQAHRKMKEATGGEWAQGPTRKANKEATVHAPSQGAERRNSLVDEETKVQRGPAIRDVIHPKGNKVGLGVLMSPLQG